MATTTSFGALSVTLAQAITYLTRSLIVHYPATTIIKLQLALEMNLTTQFESSWVPSDPLRGSGRRCLTLSPNCLPPRPVYNACRIAGVEWSQWISALGGLELDVFIDPGCVSLHFAHWDAGKFFTVWSEELRLEKKYASSSKTVAQQIILDDTQEDDELFAMLSDEIRDPTWMTPTTSQFPHVPTICISVPDCPPRSISPMSAISSISSASTHSRTSSSSSISSSGFSFSSRGTNDSYGSATTVSLSSSCSTSPDEERSNFKLSRREKARQARVFVDASKTEVTNYDGGKTTVLTGGVMLGAVAPKPKPSKLTALAAAAAQRKSITPNSNNWRSIRV